MISTISLFRNDRRELIGVISKDRLKPIDEVAIIRNQLGIPTVGHWLGVVSPLQEYRIAGRAAEERRYIVEPEIQVAIDRGCEIP